MDTKPVSFDGNNLQSFNPSSGVGIITEKIKHTTLPDHELELIEVANSSTNDIGSDEWTKRSVQLTGAIKGSSVADLEQRVDAFNAWFNGKKKNLDIGYAGSTRRYIATLDSGGTEQIGKSNVATFDITLVCTPPFGLDTTLSTLIDQANNTDGSVTFTPTVGGSAPYQLPIFTITIDALTGTDDYLQISNDANSQIIQVVGQGLANGDVVIIDSVKHEVTINGTLVDYAGTFLELDLGSNSLTYTDGFATRTVDIKAEYYKRWK